MELRICLLKVSITIVMTIFTFAKPVMSQDKDTFYEIGSDAEIPTSIKYKNKLYGYTSITIYLGASKNRIDSSLHLIAVNLNATFYDLSSYHGEFALSDRDQAYMFGWTVFNPIYYSLIKNPYQTTSNYFYLLSPAIAYSYVLKPMQKFLFYTTLSSGIVYSKVDKPVKNTKGTRDLTIRMNTYDTIKVIDRKIGMRVNATVKIAYLFKHSIRAGICGGYTHYFFKQINFNSYDIGTFLAVTF